ncbi:MAG: CDP-alcohol phosphatidyltransferase family protein, partial [Propionibacterium sp.]|nr:CDP-alcohol phosphatidyltransferase family protein [Propionibacterium sp.]
KLGQALDPLADRLYILATLTGLAIREIIPWWMVVLLISRDVLMAAVVLPLLRTRGFITLPVHFLGKTATFCLLYAFPMVLLGAGAEPWALAFRVIGWAFALWGAALYWCAGLMYFGQTLDVMRRFPPLGKGDRPSTTAAVTGSG